MFLRRFAAVQSERDRAVGEMDSRGSGLVLRIRKLEKAVREDNRRQEREREVKEGAMNEIHDKLPSGSGPSKLFDFFFFSVRVSGPAGCGICSQQVPANPD